MRRSQEFWVKGRDIWGKRGRESLGKRWGSAPSGKCELKGVIVTMGQGEDGAGKQNHGVVYQQA